MSRQSTDELRQTRHSFHLAAESALDAGNDTISLLLQGFSLTMVSVCEGIDALQEREEIVSNGHRSPLPIRHGNAESLRKRCRLKGWTHAGHSFG
jgi:hypothetical protein